NKYCATIGIPGVTAANQSPSNPRQTIECNVTQPIASYGGAIVSGPFAGVQFDDNGQPVPFRYGTLRGTSLQVGGDGNYIGDTANFSTPTDNKVLFSQVSYDLSDRLEAFVQGTYAMADADYT